MGRRRTSSRQQSLQNNDQQLVVYQDYEDDYDYDDEVNSFRVYTRDQLLATTTSQERYYLDRRKGICAGMTLAWLQLVVQGDMDPSESWPDVPYSRALQEYIEQHYIRHHSFPQVGGFTEEGKSRFDDVDQALDYIWRRPGSYMVLIRPMYARVGHAVAYSDKDSWPRGYLMNPNKGNHCCNTYSGLADAFRSDQFIRYSESSVHGPEVFIIKVGRVPNSDDDDSDAEGSDSDNEGVQIEQLSDSESDNDQPSDSDSDSDEEDADADEDDSDDDDEPVGYEARADEDEGYISFCGEARSHIYIHHRATV